jgi:hypothetical protein
LQRQRRAAEVEEVRLRGCVVASLFSGFARLALRVAVVLITTEQLHVAADGVD